MASRKERWHLRLKGEARRRSVCVCVVEVNAGEDERKREEREAVGTGREGLWRRAKLDGQRSALRNEAVNFHGTSIRNGRVPEPEVLQ